MATTQQEIKTLKKDITQLKDMLADHMEGSPGNGSSRTHFTREEVQKLANQAGESIRGFIGTKRQQFSDATVRTEEAIKERPFVSTAAAFAGGMLLATLLRRK
ncbi:MAG: hypothetical protein ACPG80_04290 [Rickettsiales bacterium]